MGIYYFCGNNPDHMWEIWRELFLEVLNKRAPIQNKKIKPYKMPWLTSTIKVMMNERDRLKRKAIISGLETDWLQYKQMRNKTTNEQRQAKSNYYANRISNQKPNPKEAWKTINHILGRKNRQTVVNELIMADKTLKSPEEIAEGFNEFFTEIGPNLAKTIETTNCNFQEFVKPSKSEFTRFNPISVNSVYHLLCKLSGDKATGMDKISSKIIKMSAPIISSSLTYIFNQTIDLCSFPNEWKIARVSPLYKNGQKNLPENCRPISVLSALSKIVERILYNQLYNYLTDNDLLPDNQFGFRKFHSTTTALLDCTNEWYINMDRKLFNLIVFIDIKKAFDTVDHGILIQKLELYGVKGNALSLLKSYLSDRTQICQVNGSVSSKRTITCGVPQGSILGPLFFLLYVNDLPQCLDKTKPRLFADDTNLTASGETVDDIEAAMNSELVNLRTWLLANKLSLNVAKTEFMVIGSKQMLSKISNREINIKIDGKKIKQVFECKTLGVNVDQHLTWKNNTDNLCKKVSSGLGAIRRLTEYLDRESLLPVYNAIVQPYFNYCCEVWDVFGKTQSTRLQKLHNRAARIITQTSNEVDHKIVLEKLGWQTLEEQRKKAKAKLMFKVLNNMGPKSLTNLFTTKNEVSTYNLRGISSTVCLPKPRTNSMKKSFNFDGAYTWNSLPSEIRESKSLAQFERKIAAHQKQI